MGVGGWRLGCVIGVPGFIVQDAGFKLQGFGLRWKPLLRDVRYGVFGAGCKV